MKTFITFSIAIITFFAVNTVSAKVPNWNITSTTVGKNIIQKDYQSEHILFNGKKVTIKIIKYVNPAISDKLVTVIENIDCSKKETVTTLPRNYAKVEFKKTTDSLTVSYEDMLLEKNILIPVTYAQK